MIPRNKVGRGITGAVRYALGEGNDPANGNKPRKEPKGEQSRVAWMSGQNFGFEIESREDADLARRVMEFMALNQTSSTKQCEKDCVHLSLGWRPGEEPTRAQMEEAAHQALKSLGMANARALFVAHSDERYAHMHIVASKINPDTGRAYDLKGDRLTLSRWAEAYERDFSGGIVCSRREEANQLRAAIDGRDAAAVLELMVQQRATFKGRDLERLLSKQIKSEFTRAQFAETILAHPDVVRLSDAAGGQTTRYTTKAVLEAEGQVLRAAARLARNATHAVGDGMRRAVLSRREFDGISREQALAYRHATGAAGLALIDGQAGTGKSFTIRAIRAAYEAERYRVIGLAPTNAVAEDMRGDGFSRAATIHSELFALKNGRTAWNARTAVIVDEAAMIDTKLMAQLARHAQEAGAKLILVGDDRQLSSIDRGGMFGVLKDRHGAAELTQVRRQGKPDERRAAEMLAEGNFQSALEIYNDKGAIHWTRSQDDARDALVAQWAKDSAAAPDKSRFVFAYTNDDVDRLNADLRAVRQQRGELEGDARAFQTKHGRADFAARDRIQFTGTDNKKGLTNGAAGTIERIEGDVIAVRLDGRAGKQVEFDAKEFQDFRHGYAGTIYKGQGRTLDQTYLYHSEHWRSAASYVGLTRHRDSTALFVARNTAEDLKQLSRQMARVDERRAASHFHTQGEDRAPASPRAEELKAELDRLMGDISRQLGKEERTPAPARSGFEHWADSPGMVEQERSAMRAARAHAPPSVASSQTLPPPVPEKDPLAQLARLMDKGESSPREAALARLFDQPTPARTAPPPMRAAAPEPEKQPEPEKIAPPIAPPTPRPEPEKNADLPRVMPPLFTPPTKAPEAIATPTATPPEPDKTAQRVAPIPAMKEPEPQPLPRRFIVSPPIDATPAATAPAPVSPLAAPSPEPERAPPPSAPPTPRPEPEKNAALPRVMPSLFTPPTKPPEPQKTQQPSDAPESAKPTTTPTGKHTHEIDPMDDFVSPERKKKAAEEAAARAKDPSRSHERGGRGRTR